MPTPLSTQVEDSIRTTPLRTFPTRSGKLGAAGDFGGTALVVTACVEGDEVPQAAATNGVRDRRTARRLDLRLTHGQ